MVEGSWAFVAAATLAACSSLYPQKTSHSFLQEHRVFLSGVHYAGRGSSVKPKLTKLACWARGHLPVGPRRGVFLSREGDGQSTAFLTSFIATCERHQMNPFTCLRDISDASAPILWTASTDSSPATGKPPETPPKTSRHDRSPPSIRVRFRLSLPGADEKANSRGARATEGQVAAKARKSTRRRRGGQNQRLFTKINTPMAARMKETIMVMRKACGDF
jgi:hypothetical protein